MLIVCWNVAGLKPALQKIHSDYGGASSSRKRDDGVAAAARAAVVTVNFLQRRFEAGHVPADDQHDGIDATMCLFCLPTRATRPASPADDVKGDTDLRRLAEIRN